jgi:ATP-dependent DNA helicase 2 subunit 2
MINVFTKKLKYKRKIYLVTNGKGGMSSDGLGDIASKLKADNIELIVLYVCSSNTLDCSKTYNY